jgi:hypothetical protein
MKHIGLILITILLCPGMVVMANYRASGQIGKGQLGNISQVAMGANDILYVLENNGKVSGFDADGERVATIETGMENTTAIAVSGDGNIHVFSTLTETKKVKSGARMREVKMPIGVECGTFDPAGKPLGKKVLNSLKSAKTAHFIDGKMAVADLSARAVVLMDAESGADIGRIDKGLRLCCGIFDFCKGPDNTIAVSNLGAFKLQRYNLDGKLVSEFGKRGRELEDFQGCCNPVSAGYLPDGHILTVEKSPTRIKIYDAEGKNPKQTVDSKGNIYLAASNKKYIVKCEP